ncbi:uncharacterized protein ARMOST_08441 [Armillaria ostoyae]|uniref:Uncharacterized protein n=1 Tax=Armillaria ostoyae TaxID=47428 RepID=A0A284R8N9_ARMOS|nr:uncharacterized protein ARMOST_08441 [Armillaria ostoyae]
MTRLAPSHQSSIPGKGPLETAAILAGQLKCRIDITGGVCVGDILGKQVNSVLNEGAKQVLSCQRLPWFPCSGQALSILSKAGDWTAQLHCPAKIRPPLNDAEDVARSEGGVPRMGRRDKISPVMDMALERWRSAWSDLAFRHLGCRPMMMMTSVAVTLTVRVIANRRIPSTMNEHQMHRHKDYDTSTTRSCHGATRDTHRRLWSLVLVEKYHGSQPSSLQSTPKAKAVPMPKAKPRLAPGCDVEDDTSPTEV